MISLFVSVVVSALKHFGIEYPYIAQVVKEYVVALLKLTAVITVHRYAVNALHKVKGAGQFIFSYHFKRVYKTAYNHLAAFSDGLYRQIV